METTRHRSLVERGGRKALLETLHTHTHTDKKIRKNPIFTNLKKRFEHIELPAKLLDYFLRNNKSNINQSRTARFLTPTSSPSKHFFRRNPKKDLPDMRSDGVESIYWVGTESGLIDIYKFPGVIYATDSSRGSTGKGAGFN